MYLKLQNPKSKKGLETGVRTTSGLRRGFGVKYYLKNLFNS